MTQAKAADIVKILINQGHEPTVYFNGSDYTICLYNSSTPFLLNQLKTFQDNHQLVGKVNKVEFT